MAATDYAYDPAGRLSRLTHAQAGTVLADYRYAYDLAGRLVRSQSAADTVTYHYDAAGQLTFADHSSQPDESYGYDKTGNRNTRDNVVGANNRPTEDATYTYQYDDEGNQTRRTSKATSDCVGPSRRGDCRSSCRNNSVTELPILPHAHPHTQQRIRQRKQLHQKMLRR